MTVNPDPIWKIWGHDPHQNTVFLEPRNKYGHLSAFSIDCAKAKKPFTLKAVNQVLLFITHSRQRAGFKPDNKRRLTRWKLPVLTAQATQPVQKAGCVACKPCCM